MTETLSSAEYRARMVAPKRNKFNARKTVVDGITFDSAAEAAFYSVLKRREDLSEVGGVELQKPFPIIAGAGIVVSVYKADFCFWDHVADRFRVVDVKGVSTPVFRLKKKLVEAQYGITVECVKAGAS